MGTIQEGLGLFSGKNSRFYGASIGAGRFACQEKSHTEISFKAPQNYEYHINFTYSRFPLESGIQASPRPGIMTGPEGVI
jgi:hypothetical protein